MGLRGPAGHEIIALDEAPYPESLGIGRTTTEAGVVGGIPLLDAGLGQWGLGVQWNTGSSERGVSGPGFSGEVSMM